MNGSRRHHLCPLLECARTVLVLVNLLNCATCLTYRSGSGSIAAALSSQVAAINGLGSATVISGLANVPVAVNLHLGPASCDFESFELTGCEDEEGSFCDNDTQKCTCKEGFPVRLLAYCLEKKDIGQECYTSAQCNDIDNAACFIFGKEYDNERISGGHNVGRQLSNWPMGMCRCNVGTVYDNHTNACVKKAVGGWCNEDWDCIKQTFNSQCSRPQFTCECTWGYMYDAKTDTCIVPKLFGSKCTADADCAPESLVCSAANRCICPKGYHYDVLHPGCKANDDSSCQYGYKWDEEWGRCIPARSSASAAIASHVQNTRNNANVAGGNKHIEPPTAALDDDPSSSLQTLLILVIPNLVGFGLIVRYCYFRKREDDTDDLEDLERGGIIRPTLSAYEKSYRQIHQLRGCPLSSDMMTTDTEPTDGPQSDQEQKQLAAMMDDPEQVPLRSSLSVTLPPNTEDNDECSNSSKPSRPASLSSEPNDVAAESNSPNDLPETKKTTGSLAAAKASSSASLEQLTSVPVTDVSTSGSDVAPPCATNGSSSGDSKQKEADETANVQDTPDDDGQAG
ncbi:hypothetical protein HDE_14203 [Halotydeus destructor]|nr:hypothetical protein HDE_14203 [Halotydeus destructor]